MTVEEIIEELEDVSDWCRITAYITFKHSEPKLFTICGLEAECLTPVQTVVNGSALLPVDEQSCTVVGDIIEWLKTKPKNVERLPLLLDGTWYIYRIDNLRFEYGYGVFDLEVMK